MSKFSVYILYSEKSDRYYIGTTDDVERRISEHNGGHYGNTFTRKGIPWILYFRIDDLESDQAYAIERHVKSMKSRKYIENLKQYEELRAGLRNRFGSPVQSR